MQSEKSKIESYIKEHNIESCLDVIINEVIEKRPSNPFKVISTLLETKSLSEILDIKLSYTFCENNNLGISCLMKTNLGKYTSNIGFPLSLQSQIQITTGQSGSSLIGWSFNIEAEEDKMNQLLKGQDPRNMKHIERLITDCYLINENSTNKDKEAIVKTMKLLISMCCFRAAASHKGESLYKFVSSYYEIDCAIASDSDVLKIPQPSISVVNSITPNLPNISFQSLNLIPTPTASSTDNGDNETNVVFNIESSLLYIKRLLLKFQAKLDTEKSLNLVPSKCGATTYTVPASVLGGDAAGKDKGKAAAAKGKAAAKGGGETLTKQDSMALGPIQMSSQFPAWAKILDEILKDESEKAAQSGNTVSETDVEISIDVKNYSQSLTAPSLKVEADVTNFLTELMNASPRITLINDPFSISDLTSPATCLKTAYEKVMNANPDRKISYCISMLSTTKLENMDVAEPTGAELDNLNTEDIEATAAADDDNKKQNITKSIINYIKLNIYEIGCFFQLAELLQVARKSGRGVMFSILSESYPETCDTFVSDFAVGLGVDYVEFGGFVSSDFNNKYSRMIAIQNEMK